MEVFQSLNNVFGIKDLIIKSERLIIVPVDICKARECYDSLIIEEAKEKIIKYLLWNGPDSFESVEEFYNKQWNHYPKRNNNDEDNNSEEENDENRNNNDDEKEKEEEVNKFPYVYSMMILKNTNKENHLEEEWLGTIELRHMVRYKDENNEEIETEFETIDNSNWDFGYYLKVSAQGKGML
eukprot:TRINITY_DN6696_c0_g1_i2.p1 TRINITY_DN6696_c0_g1~~TRINITY_DN6696_c0_g1_i2.p1  ORF type:complete len:182 (-),score=63.01 TRINITY_DN6696_c0_g1_i2:83-628(-)